MSVLARGQLDPTKQAHSMANAGLGTVGAVSYEVFPSSRIVDDVTRHLPVGSDVSVTISPASGVEPTVAVATELAGLGFEVTAHLAARMFASSAHAVEVARELQAVGVNSTLLLAGDQNPAKGPFSGAMDLYRNLAEHSAGFDRIFFAAYPDRHPFLSARAEREDLIAKSIVGDGFVSQLCLSPDAITSWIARLRLLGILTLIRVGIPGPVLARRLEQISRHLGLEFDMRAGDDQDSTARFSPTPLVEALEDDRGLLPAASSLHLYTFNDIVETRRWVDGR